MTWNLEKRRRKRRKKEKNGGMDSEQTAEGYW